MDEKVIRKAPKKILEKAEELFSVKGYNGTSIRAIAKNAEVNPALVNYHFNSKEGLYRTIFELRFSAYEKEISKIYNIEGAWGKLEFLLEIFGDFIDSNQNFHLLLSREITLLQHSSIKEIIVSNTRKNFQIIKEILSDGIESGVFRKVNIDLVTLNIIAFVPRIFSASPFIKGLLDWQKSDLAHKDLVSEQLKEYFHFILDKQT